MKTTYLFRIFVLLVIFSTLLSSCAMPGAAPQATETPTPTETIEPTATMTLTPMPTASPTLTPTATITPNLTATQQYTDFSDTLQDLYDAGYVSTKDGYYRSLSEHTMELSKINWFHWDFLENTSMITNFVVRSDVAWESASAAADNSGCGFAFHVEGDEYYIFYVSLKGIVRLNGWTGSWTRFGGSSYGSAQQNGKVNLTLIVEGTTYRVLINDKLIKTYEGFASKILSGNIGYTVLSGTNKSFGTRCTFTNSTLWLLPIKTSS